MTICEKYKDVQPLKNFDWDVYADGWNGTSLKVNSKVKSDKNVKVYCHENYAKHDLKVYFNGEHSADDLSKDLGSGSVIRIQSMKLIGKDDLLTTTATGGSAIIKLSKENKFFEMIGHTKASFKNDIVGNPEACQKFLDAGYLAKVGRNGVASLYDGMLVHTENEMHEQIALGKNANKAYVGTIVASNMGGYIMDINGVRCFLPGGQAKSNKVTDYGSLIGTKMEVMVMKYIDGAVGTSGFIVSRKKYLDTVRPAAIEQLRQEWEKDKEKEFVGSITGAKHFGIFVELNEYYTGLLHRTYVSEDVYAKLMPNPDYTDEDYNARKNFPSGTEIRVKIYNITEDGRIVFTDIMDAKEREKLVTERERVIAEAEAAAKAEAEAARKADEERKVKKMIAQQSNNFKNTTISLEDLKK